MEDDPEVPIRDLERPLADRAQASELGPQTYPVVLQRHPQGPSRAGVLALVTVIPLLMMWFRNGEPWTRVALGAPVTPATPTTITPSAPPLVGRAYA